HHGRDPRRRGDRSPGRCRARPGADGAVPDRHARLERPAPTGCAAPPLRPRAAGPGDGSGVARRARRDDPERRRPGRRRRRRAVRAGRGGDGSAARSGLAGRSAAAPDAREAAALRAPAGRGGALRDRPRRPGARRRPSCRPGPLAALGARSVGGGPARHGGGHTAAGSSARGRAACAGRPLGVRRHTRDDGGPGRRCGRVPSPADGRPPPARDRPPAPRAAVRPAGRDRLAAQPGAARGRRARRARRRRPPRRLDPAGSPGGHGMRNGIQTPAAPTLLGQTAAMQVLLHATAPAVLMGTIAALGGGGGLLLAGGTLELSGVALPVLLALVLVAARARDAAKGPMPLSLMTPIPTPQGDLSVLSVLVWQADALLHDVLAGAVLAGLLMLLGLLAM